VIVGALCLALVARQSAPGEVDFVRDVQPILRQSCWKCHGFDQQRAELRLDTRSGALAGGRNGPVIVPGHADESALVARIEAADAKERMPQRAESLPAGQIAKVRAWIDQGAKWPDSAADVTNHWAYRKPVRPELPRVNRDWWVRDPIDRFVLARLEREGLAPSPEAPRETLVRRVTLDLTGLPPTPAEVDAFVADRSRDAYERVVDRLLASPRYGERMAWEWLEAARYADTNGYQEDRTRTMWPWRDWVVDALNRNMPFDQFTIEQLAGDLLPDTTPSQRLATGFHRNHPLNGEGGAIPEESRVNYVFDRVDTTATVWLGVTFGCARCHDHKFDPFTQDEYYRLFACFNNVAETGSVDAGGNAKPVMALPTPEQATRLAAIERSIGELDAQLAAAVDREDPAQMEWESAVVAKLGHAPTLDPWRSIGPFSAMGFELAYDTEFVGRADSAGPADPADHANQNWSDHPEWEDGKVHSLAGDNSAIYLERTIVAAEATPLTLSLGSDDAIKVWLDDVRLFARKVTRAAAPDQDRVTVELRAGLNRLRMKIVNGGGPGGFYFKALEQGLPDEIVALVKTPATQRDDAQRATLRRYHAENVLPEGRAMREQLAALRKEKSELEGVIPNVMVMQEQAPPRETFVLEKGNYERRKERVEPGLPAVLAPPPADVPVNRLVLARWLVAPDHPLTARVTVNRCWQTFFGTGLVKTAEDFGVQGEPPSHPDLLDWLATEFVRTGWDVKAIHRRIVTSAAYRQSSSADRSLLERDRENRLIARGPRGRLPSFMLRDQALALSGLLVEKIGGPPVKPYQPDGVWEEATFGTIRYERDHGADLHRRSLYTFWRRIVAPTMLFDAAARQVCTVRVPRTNTPLQALILLNDVTFVEAARAFAERLMVEGVGGDAAPEERLARAFRRATDRSPTDAELGILRDAWRFALERYRADRDAAAKLVAIGETPADARLDVVELAAFTAVTNLILNLDEVLCKE